jgi:hypothetical protein
MTSPTVFVYEKGQRVLRLDVKRTAGEGFSLT